jgi:dTDP-4-dehydrorhamnose 3,5-epimerase
MMRRIETRLPGVFTLEVDVHRDPRGSFVELHRAASYREAGIAQPFVQTNLSISAGNTLRGLHYQFPRMQGKLCCVLAGEVLDVVVDIRRGSPTFGHWISALLSGENRRQVYIPPGFAHGFHVRSGEAHFHYQCDAEYDPGGQRGLRWDDPNLGIDWEVRDPLLSERDAQLPVLGDLAQDQLPVFDG